MPADWQIEHQVIQVMNIRVVRGDITKIEADAIVTAANEGLLGGGGVDGAIHEAGGQGIMKECRKIGYCATGNAVATTAGNLRAKKVIHAVGPVWSGGKSGEQGLLASCYETSILLAAKLGLSSIAFPNISTGVYGYPREQAARVAVTSVRSALGKADTRNMQVVFVCFDQENYDLYHKLIIADTDH
jgi:O-acetyl-ADP-ribose deacetylase (regulator of RNase III)